MRILIIEDEKLLADSLKALLEQNGFEADAACDGKPVSIMLRWEFMTC